jgi:phosphatidylglycerol lysyltransferase
VTRVLALLLVPWTILLALPTSSRFFPSALWQWGWVAFDAVLGVALYRLSRRWTQPLADVLVTAVTLDAVVTTAQVLAYDVPRLRSPLEGVVVTVAVLAPTFASVLLWNARARRAPAPARPASGG